MPVGCTYLSHSQPLTVPYSSVYGLRIRSDRPIPQVPHNTSTTHVDLQVSLGVPPEVPDALNAGAARWYPSDNRDDQGQSTLVISKLDDGAWFHLRYADGTEFLVDRPGTRLWATWQEPLTVEDTATYLLGPVMGFVLLLRGTHALHASAVDVGGHAIALVGPAGAGKSTTAATFAKLGYSVLAEDVTTLAREGGELMVQPAYPCIRLWPESVEALFGAPNALPLLTPNWDKRFLDLAGEDGRFRFQSDALPLRAIYFLGERSEATDAPRIEAVAPQAGMIELVANAYIPHLKDKAARADEFRVLRQVMATVPLRRAIPSADLGRVAELCAVILGDFRELTERDDSTSAAGQRECI